MKLSPKFERNFTLILGIGNAAATGLVIHSYNYNKAPLQIAFTYITAIITGATFRLAYKADLVVQEEKKKKIK